jgi:hypothetical protein
VRCGRSNTSLKQMKFTVHPFRARWLPLVAGFALSGTACEHTAPFQPDPYPPAPPFSTVLPYRLTFNIGDDRTPSWLTDGSGIIYSSEQEDRRDHDRCLTVLPAEGGTIRTKYCRLNPIYDDSTDLMESPAISPGGRIFFQQVTSWIGRQKRGVADLMLGDAGDPWGAVRIGTMPYTAPNGRIHSSLRSPQWLGADTLVYLAEQLFYEGSTFYPDTFYTGLDVVLLDFSGATPQLGVVPGTDYASSVGLSEDRQRIYYTLGGDSRVFERVLSTGAVTTVYDFGAGTIVRDAQIRGNHLVAVVGGSVLYRLEDAHGYVQRDEGGNLAFVDLSTGTNRVVSGNVVLYRHPVISPDGKRVVVEVQPYAPVHADPLSDYTATNHRADLWLFGLE